MDEGLLNTVTLLFRNASLPWAPVLGDLILPFLFNLILIGWFLLLVTEVFKLGPQMFVSIILFLMGQGFAVAMVGGDGYLWVDALFSGVTEIGYQMGAEYLNPSAMASMGPVISQPIMEILAKQGALSFFANPMTYVFGWVGHMVTIAFFLAGFMLMNILIMSYLLVALCPFFFAFAGTSFTRGMTMTYVRLVFGTLAALATMLLVSVVIEELFETMQVITQTKYANPGMTLTWTDYLVPVVMAAVILGMYVFLPYKVGHAAYGAIPSWNGVAIGGMALSVLDKVGVGLDSAWSRFHGGGNNSGQPQLAPAGGGGGGGMSWGGGGRQMSWSTWQASWSGSSGTAQGSTVTATQTAHQGSAYRSGRR